VPCKRGVRQAVDRALQHRPFACSAGAEGQVPCFHAQLTGLVIDSMQNCPRDIWTDYCGARARHICLSKLQHSSNFCEREDCARVGSNSGSPCDSLALRMTLRAKKPVSNSPYRAIKWIGARQDVGRHNSQDKNVEASFTFTRVEFLGMQR
jgi:hypothetical protein